jgi:hypothetical protein
MSKLLRKNLVLVIFTALLSACGSGGGGSSREGQAPIAIQIPTGVLPLGFLASASSDLFSFLHNNILQIFTPRGIPLNTGGSSGAATPSISASAAPKNNSTLLQWFWTIQNLPFTAYPAALHIDNLTSTLTGTRLAVSTTTNQPSVPGLVAPTGQTAPWVATNMTKDSSSGTIIVPTWLTTQNFGLLENLSITTQFYVVGTTNGLNGLGYAAAGTWVGGVSDMKLAPLVPADQPLQAPQTTGFAGSNCPIGSNDYVYALNTTTNTLPVNNSFVGVGTKNGDVCIYGLTFNQATSVSNVGWFRITTGTSTQKYVPGSEGSVNIVQFIQVPQYYPTQGNLGYFQTQAGNVWKITANSDNRPQSIANLSVLPGFPSLSQISNASMFVDPNNNVFVGSIGGSSPTMVYTLRNGQSSWQTTTSLPSSCTNNCDTLPVVSITSAIDGTTIIGTGVYLTLQTPLGPLQIPYVINIYVMIFV